jgi:hypothetical protein
MHNALHIKSTAVKFKVRSNFRIYFVNIHTFVSGGRDSSVIVVTRTKDGQTMNSISTYRKGEEFFSLSKSSDRV